MRRWSNKLLFACLLAALSAAGGAACPVGQPAVTACELIFADAPFAAAHASTLAETGRGLLVAWFGGSREGANDVQIWSARRANGTWSAPIALANGAQPGGASLPAWNPVLFRSNRGLLMLFYKIGRDPKSWRGMLMTSADEGASWSTPHPLPENILGPTKNKPIELADGTILAPSSTESGGWRVHVESSPDGGTVWRSTGPLNGADLDVIQPTLLAYSDARIQMLARNGRKDPRQPHRIVESWSSDHGLTWQPLRPTDLPNPDSGIDAVVLRDGRAALVFNDTVRGRSPLSIALSADAGTSWTRAFALDDEAGKEFSYPSVIEDSNRMLQITYTWKRLSIKHVTLDPRKL